MSIAALIVAAGRGSRAAGASDIPKQFVSIGGRPLLNHTLKVFSAHPDIKTIQVVIGTDDAELYRAATSDCGQKLNAPVCGGNSRQLSVKNGLEALSGAAPDLVLIHDAARPFVDAKTIDRVIDALTKADGVITAMPLSDTLKRSSASRFIIETLPRDALWRAQTPQGFRFGAILQAHRQAASNAKTDFTDDAAIAEWAGFKVAIVEGSSRNEKLTTPEDLKRADQTLRKMTEPETTFETRTGTGFDVHRFADGDGVWLCGIRIPFSQRLAGHSDADVGLHALTDAILGALGDGDIGDHFPPTDQAWKDARSDQFLRHAAKLVTNAGGRIINVDVTLICEAPKIGPHRQAMRACIAEILQFSIQRVSVKATTSEQLGFTGRREGIAAMASASIALPR